MTDSWLFLVPATLLLLFLMARMFVWQRRLSAEQRSRERAEQRLAELTEHLGTAIFLARQGGPRPPAVIYSNKAARELLRVDNSLAADPLSQFLLHVHDDDRSRIQEAAQLSIRTGELFREVMRFEFPGGKLGWVIAEVAARNDENGARIWSGSVFDLSSERLLHEVLNRSLAAKDRFLSAVGHELRLPVSDIHALITELDAEAFGDDDRKIVGDMKSVATDLKSLTDNLLDLSHMSTRRLTLTPVASDLHHFIGQLARNAEQACQEKGLAFELDTAQNLPGHVTVDATRLRQVLMNTLDNAVKYTEDGMVRLRASLVEAPVAEAKGPHVARPVPIDTNSPRNFDPAEEAVWLSFDVSDTGPGISRSQQKTLFQPYSVVAEAGRRSTGLGMAISHRLATLMGGAIRVISEPGCGARFVLTVPVTRQVEGPKAVLMPRPGAVSEGRGRILFVDDDRLTRLLMVSMLRLDGYVVDEAADPSEAVRLMSAQSYDGMVLDYRMPGMTGGELARQVREQAVAGHEPRIVALSAGLTDRELRESRHLFDAVLIKPVSMAQLARAMQGGAASTPDSDV